MHSGLLGRETKAFSALKSKNVTLVEFFHSEMLLLRGLSALVCGFAAALGVPGIGTHVGFIPDDDSDPDYIAMRELVR